MISRHDLSTIGKGNVHDSDGHKIGSIGQIYLDNNSGEPAWVTVSTGLFGTRASFVPLAEATVDGDDLRVPYTKAQVKGAPNVEADGELSPAEEDDLYRYYGVDPTTGTTGQATAGQGTTGHAAPGEQHTEQTPRTDAQNQGRDQGRDQDQRQGQVPDDGEQTGRRIRRYLVTEETIVRREEIPDADAPDSHR